MSYSIICKAAANAAVLPQQRVSLLECAPCALWRRLRRRASTTSSSSSNSNGVVSRPIAAADAQWCSATADVAVDAALGAVYVGCARHVLVPSSLVAYMEREQTDDKTNSSGSDKDRATALSRQRVWRTLQREQRLIVLVGDDAVGCDVERHASRSVQRSSSGGGVADAVEAFVAAWPQYTRLCVPVPAGPLAARLLFDTTMHAFYADELPRIARAMTDTTCSSLGDGDDDNNRRRHYHRGGADEDARAPRAAHDGHRRWCAWMCGALTCRYEGMYVPPIRVSEHTAQLLRDGGACEHVIWEAAVHGLTPRWLETALKTAASCGVSHTCMTLALPGRDAAVVAAQVTAATTTLSPSASYALQKALDMRVSAFATCSLAPDGVFAHAHAPCALHEVHHLVAGCNARDVPSPPSSSSPTSRTAAHDGDDDEAWQRVYESQAYAKALRHSVDALT